MLYSIMEIVANWLFEHLRIHLFYPVSLVWSALNRKGQSSREKALRSFFLVQQLEGLVTQGSLILGFGGALSLVSFLFFLGLRSSGCLGGCLALVAYIVMIPGLVMVVVGIGLIVSCKRIKSILEPPPSGEEVLAWLRDCVARVQEQSQARLGIIPDEVDEFRSYPIVTAILWPIPGADQSDILWRNDDGLLFFNLYRLAFVHFADFFMGVYVCDLNFVKDVTLNDTTHEFHYQDAVSFVTAEEASSYRLPTGKKLKSSQHFRISVASGEAIELGSQTAQLTSELKADSIPETDTEHAILAIRELLRDKKRRAVAPAEEG